MPVLVALKVGVSPETGLLLASLSVIDTVEVDAPSATIGPVPCIVELIATAPPGVKVTVPSVFKTGVSIESVFTSALRELNVQIETPEVLEAEQVP